MGKRNASPKDVFGQFADIEGTTGGTSNALEEEKLSTGLSIRGALIWLIHKLELYYAGRHTANFNGFDWAVCTVEDLAAMPDIGDRGVIARGKRYIDVITSGGNVYTDPYQQSWFPPIPIAAPNVSLYVQGLANHADGQNKDVHVRLLFTTAEMDGSTYQEIAETWGY